MKRKLFFLLALMLGLVSGIKAQQTPQNGGTYYMYNEEADLFLSRGSNWGTRAIAQPIGMPWVIEVLSSGNYKLRMYDITGGANSGSGYGDNDFTDNGTPIEFTPNGNATDGFTLQNGSNYLTCPATTGDVNRTSTASKWKFLTQAEYNAVLANRAAQQEAAIAAAKGIVIPDGQTLNDVVSDADNWASTTVNDGIPNKTTWPVTGVTNRSGNQNAGNYGEEIYQGGGWFSKTISGLKPGIYKVSVRAQKRVKGNGDCYSMGQAGYPVSDAYFNANGYIIPIKAWYENCTSDSNPNSTDAFVTIVNNGGYTKEGFVYVGNDGNLVMQARSEAYWGASWFLFNGISYTYYNNEVSDGDATAILADAASVTGKPMLGTVQDALTSAATTFDGARTIANYNVLSEAITNANASVAAYANAKAYLDGAETVLEGTNVYTTSAYNTYYATPKAAYGAKTLTNEEANALTPTSTGWHSANTIDDILLSAWTIGGEQCKDYDKTLYINTWSVEGNTDGSNFLTPFFEYWVADAQSLGANTLQATVTGLKASTTYSFTIRARVRQTNGQTKIANGITMKVGEGVAVDISAGAKFNDTQFYIGNFSAVGETDAEGRLTATITVAENSNVSWLSFYNAKYTEGEDLSAYIADYEFAKSTAIANRDNAAYAAVTGKERDDLVNAITTYNTVDETSKSDLIAAKEALETASGAFVSAAPAYTTFAELNTTVASTLGVALPSITSSTTAADLDVEGIIVAEHTAAKTYAEDYTDKLGAWTNAPGTNSGESWDGTTGDGADSYYDEYNNKSARAMTQTVTLPAGDYALIAKGRASTNGRLTVVVGGQTVTFPHKSSSGRGIATNGDATFDPEATYANSNNGRGWEYRVITFTSDGSAATTLTFNWTTASSNWCGLDDIELLYNPAALDYSALQTAYDAVVIPTLGFEAGEYAPYNNKENLENISIAKNLLENQDAGNQDIIDNATAAITGMTWTANVGEVNAVYNGDFALSENDGAQAGWQTDNAAGLGGAYHARAFVLTSGMTNYDNLAAFGQGDATRSCSYFRFDGTNSAKTTVYTYGGTDGYTMPLKNAVYRMTAQVGGWGQTEKDVTVQIVNSSDVVIGEQTVKTLNTGVNAGGNVVDINFVFSAGEGNYKLLLKNGSTSDDNAIVISNIELKKASASAKMQVSGIAKMGTFCAPFNVEIPSGVKAYTLSEVTNESWVHMNEVEGTIAAGTPVLLTSDKKVDTEVEGQVSVLAPNNSGLLQGAFVQTDVPNNDGNYLLQYQDGECAFYLVDSEGKQIGANRCYLHIEKSGETLARIAIGGEDGPTGINEIEAIGAEAKTMKDGKYLVKGRIVLVKSGNVFDVNGQLLK